MNKTFVPAVTEGQPVHLAANDQKLVFVQGKHGFCYNFNDPEERMFPFSSFTTNNDRVNFVSIRDTELTTNFCFMIGTDSEIYIVNQKKRTIHSVDISDTSDIYTLKMPSYAAAWDPFERNISFISGDKSMLHHFVVYLDDTETVAFKSTWDIYIGCKPLQILYTNDALAPIYELTSDWVLRLIRWNRRSGDPPVVQQINLGDRVTLALNPFDMVFASRNCDVFFVDPDVENITPNVTTSIDANMRIESLFSHPSYPSFLFATTESGSLVAMNIEDPSYPIEYEWDITTHQNVKVIPHGDDFMLVMLDELRFEFLEFHVGSPCRFEKKKTGVGIVSCRVPGPAVFLGDPFASEPNKCAFLSKSGEVMIGSIELGSFHLKTTIPCDDEVDIRELYFGSSDCLYCLTGNGHLCQFKDSQFVRIFESLQNDSITTVSFVPGRRGFALTAANRVISFNAENPKDNCAIQLNSPATFLKGVYDPIAGGCVLMLGLCKRGILFFDELLESDPELMSETNHSYSYPYSDADMVYPTLVAIDSFPTIVVANREEIKNAKLKTSLGLAPGKVFVSADQSYMLLENSRIVKYNLPSADGEMNLGLEGARVLAATRECIFFVSPVEGIGCHVMKERTECRPSSHGSICTTKFPKKCVWDIRDQRTIVQRNTMRLRLARISAVTEREDGIVRMLSKLLGIDSCDSGSERIIVQSIYRNTQNCEGTAQILETLSMLVLHDQNGQWEKVVPGLVKLGMLEMALGYYVHKSEHFQGFPECLGEAIVDRLFNSGDWLKAARLLFVFGSRAGYQEALKHIGLFDDETHVSVTDLTAGIEAHMGFESKSEEDALQSDGEEEL